MINLLLRLNNRYSRKKKRRRKFYCAIRSRLSSRLENMKKLSRLQSQLVKLGNIYTHIYSFIFALCKRLHRVKVDNKASLVKIKCLLKSSCKSPHMITFHMQIKFSDFKHYNTLVEIKEEKHLEQVSEQGYVGI